MKSLTLSKGKAAHLRNLSDEKGIISALAFDQRGALKRLMAQYQESEPTVAQMEELKVLVAEELTPYASSMLLDPEFGLPATKVLDWLRYVDYQAFTRLSQSLVCKTD